MTKAKGFTRFAAATAHLAGQPAAFAIACLFIIVWAASGPFMGFSERWQLVVNTGTTIITFLMVFIIQNTQNRDSAAVQVKLDELIRATKGARNALLDLEELSEEQIEEMRAHYEHLARRARKRGGPEKGPAKAD
jgi:low affinity Fe/Cu permease